LFSKRGGLRAAVPPHQAGNERAQRCVGPSPATVHLSDSGWRKSVEQCLVEQAQRLRDSKTSVRRRETARKDKRTASLIRMIRKNARAITHFRVLPESVSRTH